MFSYKTLIYTLSVLLLAGCLYWRLSSGVKAEEEPAPPTQGDQKAPPQPKDLGAMIEAIPLVTLDEGVLMQSDDIKVAMANVEKAEKGMVEYQTKMNPQFTMPPKQQNMMRKHFAFRFFVNEVVEKYSKDNKIEVSKDAEAEFNKFKAQQEAQGANYNEILISIGMNDADFRRAWSLNAALEKKLSDSVKNEDVDSKFEEYKKTQIDNAPLRRASHILFMYKGAQGAEEANITRSKDEAKALAEAAIKKIKEGGDFAALAKEQSDCPSKAKGGDLDFFPRKGAMVDAFAEATYKLEKVGDVTGIVESPFGFHIIKLTEMHSDQDIKDQIRQSLSSEKLNQLMQQMIESGLAKAKFNVKLLPPPPPEAPAPAPAPATAPKVDAPKLPEVKEE